MAAQKIITCTGKGVDFVACRRRGNVNAQHPRIIAITPLEVRQTDALFNRTVEFDG